MMTITQLPEGTPTKVAYRAINGDDATAELDNPAKPFCSMDAIFQALQALPAGSCIPEIKDIGYLPQPRVKSGASAPTPTPAPETAVP